MATLSRSGLTTPRMSTTHGIRYQRIFYLAALRSVNGMPRTRIPTAADESMLKAMAEQIRERRSEAGLTQEKLAWAAGVSKSYLCEIEAGTKAPSLFVLRALAERLDVTPGRLLDGGEVTPTVPDRSGG